ncbi:hypothetical protein T439DRAFT_279137, partial [Meredithblackwellia eburnea MCA 4105]
ISWAFNWANFPAGELQNNVEFVPQLWGGSPDLLSAWPGNATMALANGATAFLGFNEPDQAAQANLSVQQAVFLWRQYMEPFAGNCGLKLISPAITNGEGPNMGLQYLVDFLGNCTACHIDAVAAHWYAGYNDTQYFKDHFTQIYNTTGKNIWVTEFMGWGTPEQETAFVEEIVPWLEEQPFIEKYALFGEWS